MRVIDSLMLWFNYLGPHLGPLAIILLWAWWYTGPDVDDASDGRMNR